MKINILRYKELGGLDKTRIATDQFEDIIYKLSVVTEFEQLEAINKAICKIERKIQKLERKNDSFQ